METLITELFDIIHADSQHLLKEAYQIRYEAFCIEKEGLKGTDYVPFIDGEKTDEYEKYSKYSLLLYKPTQKYVATVRLICPKLGLGNKKLPIEIAADGQFYSQINYPTLPRELLAELSQFVIAPSFRPKFAMVGLLRAVFAMCYQNDINYLVTAMEPHLRRLLQILGVQLNEISPIINYHGRKKCFLGSMQEILEQLYLKDQKLWREITGDNSLNQAIVSEKKKQNDEDGQMFNYF